MQHRVRKIGGCDAWMRAGAFGEGGLVEAGWGRWRWGWPFALRAGRWARRGGVWIALQRALQRVRLALRLRKGGVWVALQLRLRCESVALRRRDRSMYIALWSVVLRLRGRCVL